MVAGPPVSAVHQPTRRRASLRRERILTYEWILDGWMCVGSSFALPACASRLSLGQERLDDEFLVEALEERFVCH